MTYCPYDCWVASVIQLWSSVELRSCLGGPYLQLLLVGMRLAALLLRLDDAMQYQSMEDEEELSWCYSSWT